MAGSQHFSQGDIQLQLVYDRGQCAESSSLNPILPGLLNTLQTRGGVFYPPPNSFVFYPRRIKIGM